MADFQWLNAVPLRRWSAPDREWRHLSMERAEFAARSQGANDHALIDAFQAWAARQVHRNYAMIWDDADAPGGKFHIAMRMNPVIGSRPASNRIARRRWSRPGA